MPHPPLYNGGQDDDLTRAIDNVHIEPSIREGTFLVSSIYGRGASAPVNRFPPTFVVQPFITGSTQIPSTLTCEPGQTASSPAANYSYQWMRDGVDIPGATNKTYTTNLLEDDQTTISCEVRAFNPFGEDYGLTAGVYVTLIEPVEVHDYDFAAITGLNQTRKTVTRDERTVITSGMAALNRQDVNRLSLYMVSGRAADTRSDQNTMHFAALQGLGGSQRIDLHDADVAAISYDSAQVLVDGERVPVNLKNNDAEAAYLGWVVDGRVTYNHNDGHGFEGETYWEGGIDVDAGQFNVPYSRVTQDVEMFDPWHADIDAGSCFLEWNWQQSSFNQSDFANVKIEFLDVNKTVISTADPQGLWAGPQENYWVFVQHEAAIPASTRFVRFVMEFALSAGENSNGRIDMINGYIRKGAKPAFTDVGPSAQMWRLYFTRARTYPGVSLSEIEFRGTPGGVDLATGGSVLFGSAGNGGLAQYAFDDLRNTGYWAGEQSGVANGTSWIGYDMGTPVRPQEIDVTLRANQAALEFGRDFLLQMTDDGNNWYNVQYYRDIPDPAPLPNQQQLQFPVVPPGPVAAERTKISSANYFRNSLSVDDYATKGMVFRSKVRMDITHLQYFPLFSTQEWDAQVRIGKASFNQGRWMIETIHEVLNRNHPASEGTAWRELALTTPYRVNCLDYFFITVTDLQAASNSVDANEGRIVFLDSVVMNDGSSWTENLLSRRWYNFARNDIVITPGDIDEAVASNTGNLDYAVDFRGTII